jgi:hypothetical protein
MAAFQWENNQNDAGGGGGGREARVPRCKENAFFCALFILEMIILPRQAREKHRENSPKDEKLRRCWRFLAGFACTLEHSGVRW